MEIVSIDTRIFDEMIRQVKTVENKAVTLYHRQEDLTLKNGWTIRRSAKCWVYRCTLCKLIGKKACCPAPASSIRCSISPKMSRHYYNLRITNKIEQNEKLLDGAARSLHGVAEIFECYLTRYDERIRCFCHKMIVFRKYNYFV